MTAHEVRKANLVALIRDFYGDSQAEFARALSVSPSYVNQLVRGPEGGGRGMGASTARRIEKLQGLPKGWMDAEHTAGEVESISLTPLERAALDMFKELTPRGQATAYGEVTKIFLEERRAKGLSPARAAGLGIDYTKPTVFETSHEERVRAPDDPMSSKKVRTAK